MSFKDTSIGVIPIAWDVVEISQLLHEGSRNGIYKKKEFHGRGVKIVNMGELFSYEKISAQEMKRVDLTEEEKNKFLLKEGDLLFARRSLTAEGAGKSSIIGKLDEETTFESSIIRLRVNSQKVNSYFLYYYFKSPFGRHSIGSILRQTAVAGITGSDLVKLEVPIPKIHEQNNIIRILSSLDEKIELNNQMNKTLEEMAQALFKRWFVDFEFPSEDGEPYKSSGGEMVDSELGMIPKGWEVKCISEVCYFNKSSYTNKDSWEYINYLDTANITTNEINEIQRIDCSVDKIPSRAKRKVEKDSLVYSTVRPNQLHYGMIKKPVENMLVSTGFVVLDSKSTFLKNDLIYYWLIQEDNTEKLQAIAETTTSTYPSIKATDIKNMKIVLPTKELLLELSSKFGQINSYINSLQEESSTLKGIRETLLPKLMSGELRVTDL